MVNPLVSIVIPCYNHESFVQDCIQSVINQTYQNIELIIIDDGSKDNSVGKIQELVPLCEKRFVRFEFRYRSNKGLSATLNEALGWCNGKYYSAIASDDIMLPHKISLQVDIMETSNHVGVFGGMQFIDENGHLGRIVRQKQHVFTFSELIYTDSFLPAPSQFLLLDKIKQVGGFKEGMIVEDWYMWLKLMEDGSTIQYVDELLVYYRRHTNNTYTNPFKSGFGCLQVLNEFDNHPNFKKAYIKAFWQNSISTLIDEPKLSTKILLERLIHYTKISLSKLKFKAIN